MAHGLALLIILLGPQIWAVLTRRGAAARTGLLCLSLLTIVAAILLLPTRIVLHTATVDRAYHDTYYVVSHGHYLTAFLLFLGGLLLLLALAERRSTLPRIAPPLASLMALTVTLLVLHPVMVTRFFGMPRRYVEYDSFFVADFWLQSVPSYLFAACILLLGLMAIWTLVRSFRR